MMLKAVSVLTLLYGAAATRRSLGGPSGSHPIHGMGFTLRAHILSHWGAYYSDREMQPEKDIPVLC